MQYYSSMDTLDKYRGCLVGGAAGDALGYPVEFMSRDSIISRYGERGITSYELRDGLAEISDDTQMTLFTATGMMHGETRARIRGIGGAPWTYVALSYKDWYRTQTEEYPLVGNRFSWLVDEPRLFSRRAPGATCLSAIASGMEGSIEDPINDSKGCGGVMRAAPVGLYYGGRHEDLEFADRVGAQVAALTHGHPLGYIPAAALTHIIALIVHYDYSIKDAVRNARSEVCHDFDDGCYINDFIQLFDKACTLAEDASISDIEAIRQLGEGWVAEEALAIAVFCSLRHCDDFAEAICAAVNHDGDSDSTGSITGNIVGAHLGLSGIPSKYLERLELKDVILEIADDLYQDCDISEYNHREYPEWDAKYFHNRSPKAWHDLMEQK